MGGHREHSGPISHHTLLPCALLPPHSATLASAASSLLFIPQKGKPFLVVGQLFFWLSRSRLLYFKTMWQSKEKNQAEEETEVGGQDEGPASAALTTALEAELEEE